MRPSLLAGPQAGRDFREEAGNGAWPVQTYSTAQNAHCQQTVVFRQQTVVFPRPPQHWGPGRLGGCSDPAGWKAGDIRSKQFRHTYATARLQTTDRGAPVAAWTVAKELGHSGTAMLEKTYGHLGEVRHRSEVVEYRVEQHEDKLRDRLSRLLAVTSGNHKEGADGGVSR